MAFRFLGLEFSREKRAELTIESPSLSFSDWIDGAIGTKTNADITVTDQNSLTLSAVYGCVKIISETIAELPIDLFRLTDTGKEKVNNDISYLIGTSPNDLYSSYTFRQALQACALLYGNGYALIDWKKSDMTIKGFILLDPTKVEVKRVDKTGDVIYVVGEKMILEPWQVLHIKGMSLDGIVGLSPLTYHKESIANGLALQEFGNKFFGQGMLAMGILTRPTPFSSQKEVTSLRKEFEKAYKGRTNAQKVMIVDAGMDYKKISIDPEQAQFLQSRNYNVEDIARVYRVPQHMLQKLDRSTNNNIEHQSLEFMQYCMLPWVKNWEQELDRKLLKRADGTFWKFNLNALMRGDTVSRAQYYVQAIQNGWLTRNEVRELENMNTLPGLDAPLTPLNLTTNPENNGKDDTTDRTEDI